MKNRPSVLGDEDVKKEVVDQHGHIVESCRTCDYRIEKPNSAKCEKCYRQGSFLLSDHWKLITPETLRTMEKIGGSDYTTQELQDLKVGIAIERLKEPAPASVRKFSFNNSVRVLRYGNGGGAGGSGYFSTFIPTKPTFKK